MLTPLLAIVPLLRVAAASAASAVDVPFPQVLSWRAGFKDAERVSPAFSVLPFALAPHHDVLSEASGGRCVVALSDEGSVFATLRDVERRPYDQFDRDLGPWSAFIELEALGDACGTGQRVLPSANDTTFLVVSNQGVCAVELDDSCASVLSTRAVTSGSVPWADEVVAVALASSPELLFVADSEARLFQISIETGAVTRLDFVALSRLAPATTPTAVTAMQFVDAWDSLFVGTDLALFTVALASQDVTHEWVGGVLDTPPLDFAVEGQDGDTALWIAEWGALHRLNRAGTIDRFSYHQGAPFVSNITSVAVLDNQVVVGSAHGAAALDLSRAQAGIGDTLPATLQDCAEPVDNDLGAPWRWHVWQGHRYLTDDTVASAVAVALGGGVMLSSALGLNILELQPWTLLDKARALERAQVPRHDREGLVASVPLSEYGDVSSWGQTVSDNDGLWTAMHTMGEAFCTATTSGHEAVACRARAWRSFEALETLSHVTGAYPWFVARSFCNANGSLPVAGCGDADGSHRWQDSTTKPGYKWKNDTSTDELDGHMAALPVVLDLVADSPEKKARVVALLDGIVGGLLDNGLRLIDPTTGQGTTWAFFEPNEINLNPAHYSERGPNSLAVLSYLMSAYSVTGKQRYHEAWWHLADAFGYADNTANVKIDNPEDDNHSDNELITLTYHTAFYALHRLPPESARRDELAAMVDRLLPGASRTWGLVRGELNPLWLAVYSGLGGLPVTSATVRRSLWSLRRFPLDLINWETDLTKRVDLTTTPYHVRDNSGDTTVRELTPPSQRTVSHYNVDPFEASSGGGGTAEFAPCEFRLPYFAARFYGLLR